jgi:acetyl esterase
MSPPVHPPGLRWTTIDHGRSDASLDHGIRLAHRLGWGRMHRMSIDEVRAHMAPLPWPLGRVAYGAAAKVPVHDLSLPTRDSTVQARVYAGGEHPRAPLVVFFHGGGFVAGDLNSHDHVCRALAVAGRAVLVAVHYRRAPEAPYPAAVHDAADAIEALADRATELGVNTGRISLCGDSAGANLSVAAALYLLDHRRGPPIAQLLLVYPAADHTMSGASMHTRADGALLCAEDVRTFHQHYFPEPHPAEPPRYFSLLQLDSLANLPPTCIALAGRDPLRDDGAGLAHKLVHAGVSVEVREYAKAIHGYWLLPGISLAARHTTAWFADRIRTAE